MTLNFQFLFGGDEIGTPIVNKAKASHARGPKFIKPFSWFFQQGRAVQNLGYKARPRAGRLDLRSSGGMISTYLTPNSVLLCRTQI